MKTTRHHQAQTVKLHHPNQDPWRYETHHAEKKNRGAFVASHQPQLFDEAASK